MKSHSRISRLLSTWGALEAHVGTLTATVHRLEALLERAIRDSKRQGAPFSRGEPKKEPKSFDCLSDWKYGKSHRPLSDQRSDRTINVPLPLTYPTCGGQWADDHVDQQFQVEFPRQPHTFLYEPDSEATKWPAEQVIRLAVANRKVFGGNRRSARPHAQDIPAGSFTTCAQHARDVLAFLANIVRLSLIPTLHFSGNYRRFLPIDLLDPLTARGRRPVHSLSQISRRAKLEADSPVIVASGHLGTATLIIRRISVWRQS